MLIALKKASSSNKERSPLMSVLYFIIFEYGGCVQIKSILSSLIKDRSVASPFLTKIFDCVSYLKFRFVSDKEIDCGLISIPTAFRLSNFASTNVVPLPKN